MKLTHSYDRMITKKEIINESHVQSSQNKKNKKNNAKLTIIRIELKIGTGLKYTITNEISKIPILPTSAKKFIERQR